MNLMKKRWLILIVSCLVNLCIGSLYSWSVFATPMAAHITEVTGQEISNLAIVFTIANSIGPVTMISGGYVNDKLGPKWVLLIGSLMFGGGMIGASFATSVTTLVLTYSLGVGLGMGMVYGTTVSNTVKFFPDKRGFVGGMTTAFYGGSSILIPPLANLLIQNYHVTTAFRIIGLVALTVIAVSAFIIIPCPKDFRPEGWNPGVQNGQSTGHEYNYRQMFKDTAFPLMLLILTCGAFSGLMVISQISPIAQTMIGFSVSQAAVVVSVLALFNTIGRIACGLISDRIGTVNTLTMTFTGSVLASLLLYFSNESRTMIFYIGLSVIGFCFGAIMGIYPGFTAAQFGSKNNSVNYGIMFIGFALAGAVGPIIMGSIYSGTSRYQPAFLVSAALAVIGFALIQVFRFVQRKSVAAKAL